MPRNDISQAADPEPAYAALLPISNESFYFNARTLFADASHDGDCAQLSCICGIARDIAADVPNVHFHLYPQFHGPIKK
jgi:hypothetical protein